MFTYARKIGSQISGILVRPVSLVFFNHFSAALAEGDEAIKSLTRKALRITLLFTTLACVATLAGGHPGLKALWLSEKFTAESVFKTYIVVCILCFLPIVSGTGVIFRKINMSHLLVRSQYFLLMLVQIIGAILAVLLIKPLGLAGAVSVVVGGTLIGTLGSGWLLKSKHPESFATYLPSDLFKCGIILVVSTVPLIWIQFNTTFFEGFFKGRTGYLISATILITASLVLAVILALLFQIDEVKAIILRLKQFLGRHTWKRNNVQTK